MKGIICSFFVMLSLLGTSCSKEFEDTPPKDTPSDPTFGGIKEMLDKLGVKPKNAELITDINEVKRASDLASSFTEAEKTGYMFVAGQMGDSAWLAKFDDSGNELYSIITPPISGWKKYAGFNWFKYINKDFFFNTTTLSNDLTHTEQDYGFELKMIDFKTGKVVQKLPIDKKAKGYSVERHGENYYVTSSSPSWSGGDYPTLSFYCLNKNGLLWSRATVGEEIENGFNAYKDRQWLSSDIMLHFTSTLEHEHIWERIAISVVDMNKYRLLFTIFECEIPFTGDRAGEKNIDGQYKTSTLKGDEFRVYFDEREHKRVLVDPVQGKYEDVYTTVGEYYYSVAYPKGTVLSKHRVR